MVGMVDFGWAGAVGPAQSPAVSDLGEGDTGEVDTGDGDTGDEDRDGGEIGSVLQPSADALTSSGSTGTPVSRASATF